MYNAINYAVFILFFTISHTVLRRDGRCRRLVRQRPALVVRDDGAGKRARCSSSVDGSRICCFRPCLTQSRSPAAPILFAARSALFLGRSRPAKFAPATPSSADSIDREQPHDLANIPALLLELASARSSSCSRLFAAFTAPSSRTPNLAAAGVLVRAAVRRR